MENLSTLTDLLRQQLSGKEAVTEEQAQEWLKLYPYFSLPLMLYLHQNEKHDNRAVNLASVYASDLTRLAALIGKSEEYIDLYPTESSLQAKSTDDTIELFLQTYGNNDSDTEEWLLSDNISDDNISSESALPTDTEIHPQKEKEDQPYIVPVYDYMSTVEALPDAEDATPLQGEELLSKFINAEEAGEQLFSKPDAHTSSPNINQQSPTSIPSEDEKEPLFTESLAKIYIRQRRYAKALEIIRKLSLNNPEKNVYFADQIRFLEKLIINIKN